MPVVSGLEKSAEDLMRAVGGGLILGVPLLFTMEMWWLGRTATPINALAVLGLTFVPVAILSATVGFRKEEGLSVSEVVTDALEAVGVGLVCCGAVLLLLQRITTDLPLSTAVQMIVFETAPFAVGAAVASQFFSGDSGRSNGDEGSGGGGGSAERSQLRATVRDLGATAIGAVAIALSIAPTEEISMLANSISDAWMVSIIAASLLISYGIVFVAGFADKDRRINDEGLLQRPISETVAAYVVALLAAAAMLWMFNNLHLGEPLGMGLQRTVVMSLPASIGGAAGRLAV